MQVATIMTRDVVTVGMDDTLAEVREVFDTHRFHHLIVVENGRVAGVVSDRDLLKHLSPFVGKLSERRQDSFTLEKKVHQVMSRHAVTIHERDDLSAATKLMLDHGVSCLPVIDDAGAVLGIVTWRDLLRAVAVCGINPACKLPNSAA